MAPFHRKPCLREDFGIMIPTITHVATLVLCVCREGSLTWACFPVAAEVRSPIPITEALKPGPDFVKDSFRSARKASRIPQSRRGKGQADTSYNCSSSRSSSAATSGIQTQQSQSRTPKRVLDIKSLRPSMTSQLCWVNRRLGFRVHDVGPSWVSESQATES